MLQVRLVPVSQAGSGAWPVYESATGIPVIQMQSNPGAVPVYVGPIGYGSVPVRFSSTPSIPIAPPDPPVTTYYILRSDGSSFFLRPDGTSFYVRP